MQPDSEAARPRLNALSGLVPAGGYVSTEVAAARLAAVGALEWLKAEHPEWLPSADSSQILSESMREDLFCERLAKRGAAYVGKAVNGVKAYDLFASKSFDLWKNQTPLASKPDQFCC